MTGGPITIRGTAYPDADAVAAAFGISRQAVHNAIRRGRGDYIGIPAHLTRKRTGAEPLPVRVRGMVFPSAADAAKHFGVSVITVRVAILEGREDYVGQGKSRKHSTGNKGRIPANAKPVQIGPYSWTSTRLCATALGIGSSSLRAHLRAGDAAWLLARAMEHCARQEGHKARAPDMPTAKDKANHGAAMLAAWNRRKATAGERVAA